MRFHDRHDAGRRLSQRLRRQQLVDPVVLALSPGGVPVGFEVAHGLDTRLQVFDVAVWATPSDRSRTLAGRDVILIDDGAASEAQIEQALRALRLQSPRQLLVAIPVCDGEVAERLQLIADGLVCVQIPAPFGAVANWYHEFDQATDDEVYELLARSS